MATRQEGKPRRRAAARRGVEYLEDEYGRRLGVIVPIRMYKRLAKAAEDLRDLRAAAKARVGGGESVPREAVRAEMRAKRASRCPD